MNRELTVKDLLEHIIKHNLPLNAKIYFQRIEDVYFKDYNWKVVKKEGEEYFKALKWNERIDSGYYLDKEEFPNLDPNILVKCPSEELEELKEQYIRPFSFVKYDSDNNIYIDAHY